MILILIIIMESLKLNFDNSFILVGTLIVAFMVIKMLFPAEKAIVLNGSSNVVLEIQYCGGWGYTYYYNQLLVVLNEKFPNQLTIKPLMDSKTTGNFEIKLNGKLVHSKMTKGQGKCESKEEREELINKITLALK